MARIRRSRRVLGLVLVLLTAWIAASAWQVHRARSEADAARAELRTLREGATAATLVDPATLDALDRASARLDEAHAALHGPVLAPWRVLPVAGRQLRAVDRSVTVTAAATDAARDGVRDLAEIADRPHPAGPERVTLLRDVAAVARRTERRLAAADPGDTVGLIGPVADAVNAVRRDRAEARRGLRRAAATSDVVADLFAGPTRYLLLGANNAEMRAGSGMFLSAATLRLQDGRIDLGEVRPTADLELPPGSVPASGDLAVNWSFIEPGRDLRNLGLTADFPVSATLAARNWAKVPDGGPVTGVVAVDVDALRALLRVVGPVEVDGIRYTADSVRGELLRRQYSRFDGDRDARRDQIGAVAKAVLGRIESGEWAFADLATAMADSVAGRHLLLWSADPAVQRAWDDAGASGRLHPDSVSVDLINRGAEKLDSFLVTRAALRATRRRDGDVDLTLTYVVRNDAPATGPTYLVGPNIAGAVAGEHRGIVLVNLPGSARRIRTSGGRPYLAGRDGATAVVGAEVRLRRGESVTITVRAVLPGALEAVRLEPSARVPRTTWTVDGTRLLRERRRTVALAPR